MAGRVNKKAFTLVEILIVVIILGILAAIVIPQFSQASDDARSSSLQADLQTVRSQLEMYKMQHGCYPSQYIDESGTTNDDTANFRARLTSKTDANGNISATGTFGPYMQKFPTNSFASTGKDTVAFEAAPDGLGTTGWNFSTTMGKFTPNDSEKTNGVAHTAW